MPDEQAEVRERALETLDLIRAALVDNDLHEAIAQIDVLEDQLVDWRRADARDWLDNALRGDLLLFNIDAARQRLEQWQATLDDPDEDLARYRERVETRTREKQLELQARGVIAHCQELWRQADELERGESAMHPDQMIETYFRPAYELAQAAVLEYPANARLKDLEDRARSFYEEKQNARTIYPMAIEEDRYADALDTLEALDLLDRVPRFRVVGTEDDRRTVFVGMISYRDAQEDLTRRGRAWADQHIARVIQDVHDHLEAYDPQAALDVLAARKRVERFAEDEISEKLRSFEQRANEDLRKRQHAERRSAQAIQLLEQGNPLGAWDIYREAYAVYSGAPSLPETRDAVLAQMISDLETMIVKAEEAFNARLMERIGQIYQSARVDYSDKAPELEGLLSRLEEIDWQARAFTEYRSSASQMLDEMRDLVITDVSAAADMLARLEEYPVLVLDDLPGLVEVRAAIRRRLNVEMLYNRLYKLLHSDSIEEVEQGVAESADQRDDDRFRQLEFDLETHLNYLNGHLEYAVGQRREALMLFQQVAEHDGHPDQSDAQRLIHEIEADMQAPDEPEIDSE